MIPVIRQWRSSPSRILISLVGGQRGMALKISTATLPTAAEILQLVSLQTTTIVPDLKTTIGGGKNNNTAVSSKGALDRNIQKRKED